MPNKNILIIDNLLSDVIKSRIGLGDHLKSLGNNVIYACPNDAGNPNILDIKFSRKNFNIGAITRAVIRLNKIENQYCSHAILSFRFVPNVLNVISACFNTKRKRVLVITGLGLVFMDSKNHRLTRFLVSKFYKWASTRFSVVVQNIDDARELKLKSYTLINGSGVEGDVTLRSFNNDTIRLLYAGRLLKSKGVMESLEIFVLLKDRGFSVSLSIAGDFDAQNPDSISMENYLILKNTVGVELLGHVDDMNNVYRNTDVLLFLSTYREGVPRVMIESLQNGLTICSFNQPGCRECVDNNGIIINCKDNLGEIIEYIAALDSNKLYSNMCNSHELFSTKFSSTIVYNDYLRVLTS